MERTRVEVAVVPNWPIEPLHWLPVRRNWRPYVNSIRSSFRNSYSANEWVFLKYVHQHVYFNSRSLIIAICIPCHCGSKQQNRRSFGRSSGPLGNPWELWLPVNDSFVIAWFDDMHACIKRVWTYFIADSIILIILERIAPVGRRLWLFNLRGAVDLGREFLTTIADYKVPSFSMSLFMTWNW